MRLVRYDTEQIDLLIDTPPTICLEQLQQIEFVRWGGLSREPLQLSTEQITEDGYTFLARLTGGQVAGYVKAQPSGKTHLKAKAVSPVVWWRWGAAWIGLMAGCWAGTLFGNITASFFFYSGTLLLSYFYLFRSYQYTLQRRRVSNDLVRRIEAEFDPNRENNRSHDKIIRE